MTHALHLTRRLFVIGLGLWLAAAHIAQAAEIRVITSGAFTEAYKKLVPEFEKQTGHQVIRSSAHLAPR